jgi:hypothetical protein
VTSQKPEVFKKREIKGQEVIDAVYLHTKDALKVRAFGDDVVDPRHACPLDSAQFYETTTGW